MKLPQLSLRDLFWLVLVGLILCQESSACGILRRRYRSRACSHAAVTAAPARSRPPTTLTPQLIGLRAEVLDQDKWRVLRDNEGLHDDDDLRHSPVLQPDDFSQVVLIRMLKRPVDDATAMWEEFARSKNGERWVYGSGGLGDWSVTIEVHFKNGRVVRLDE